MELMAVTNKQKIRDFHRVPRIIYSDDANYVPHLKQDIEAVFDPRRNKLFALGGEAIRWVLRDTHGALIGRVAAFVFPISKQASNPTAQDTALNVGGMGFFECINDHDAAHVLFSACKDWLEQRNMNAIDGPINFGEKNDYWGLLVENFSDEPAYRMNYNPYYYKNLFETFGFNIYFKQYVFHRNVKNLLSERFHVAYERVSTNSDFSFRTIRGKPLTDVAQDFCAVYNSAWVSHHGFVPLAPHSLRKSLRQLKPILDPDIVCFLYFKETPVAFYMNIPETNDILKRLHLRGSHGELSWFRKMMFLYHQWRTPSRRTVGIAFGVAKEFQKQDLDLALIRWGQQRLAAKKYETTTLAWIGDFNPKMLAVAKQLGAHEWRELATYRYLFDRNAPFERHPVIE